MSAVRILIGSILITFGAVFAGVFSFASTLGRRANGAPGQYILEAFTTSNGIYVLFGFILICGGLFAAAYKHSPSLMDGPTPDTEICPFCREITKRASDICEICKKRKH